MKIVYTLLLCSLGMLVPGLSQTLLRWPLTTSQLGEPKVIAETAVSGLPLVRGNGISVLTFTGSGVSAENWAPALIDEAAVDFYQFGLKALPGQTVEITGLAFSERRSSSGPLTFALYYSRNDFASQALVTEVLLPDDMNTRSHSFPLHLKIADGEEMSFRLYAYDSEGNNGSWTLAANTLQVLGSAMPSCTPPTTPATIQLNTLGTETVQVTVSAGNGQGRLLVVAPAGAALPKPYQGEAYLGNTIYGQGELLGVASYVIGSTTATSSTHTIAGLTPGTAYQLFVYEYINGAMCYARSPASLTFTTACTTTPQRVQEVHYTSLDGRVAIQWEGVACFDKYLVVASAQPIVGSPAGTNYSNSSNFGTGAARNGFAAGVYSVFSGGNSEEVVVTNLANGTPYYFAIFVRLGNRWSTGYYFSSQPEAACSRVGYERIFINEFHYLNGPVS